MIAGAAVVAFRIVSIGVPERIVMAVGRPVMSIRIDVLAMMTGVGVESVAVVIVLQPKR